jgi:ABC-type uncharacterized transport system substrate-binding protein
MTASRLVLIVALMLGLLVAPLAADTQPTKIPRIGVAFFGSPGASCVEVFRQGLRDASYVEGQTLAVEYRYAEGKEERYAELMSELVRLKPDVIAVAATGMAQVARQATTTIPVVFMFADQPVAMGLVASLARPGGNLTGLTTLNAELSSKRLELVREAFPRLRRVGVLSSTYPLTVRALKEAEAAARALGIKLWPVTAERADQLDAAFAAMVKRRVEALLVVPHPLIQDPHAQRIFDLAVQRRLPVIYGGRLWAARGALIAYGAQTDDLCRGAAALVAKILKGAKPADLPVEQPTKFELVINLKTAKALGLTIPPSVLARADEIIE